MIFTVVRVRICPFSISRMRKLAVSLFHISAVASFQSFTEDRFTVLLAQLRNFANARLIGSPVDCLSFLVFHFEWVSVHVVVVVRLQLDRILECERADFSVR